VRTDDEAMELKKQCVNLLFDCPLNRCQPACPFSKARKQDVVERVNWLKGLSLSELKGLAAHHGQCSARTDRNGVKQNTGR
jgi:hypothetical protein